MSSLGSASEPSAAPPPALLVVLVFATGVGPLFNLGLAAAAPILTVELNISAGTFGLLITILFASAAAASIVTGRLADILSVRDQLILNFGGTALALVIAAIGPIFTLMVVAMVVGGLAQVIANASTNKVISRNVPSNRRANWVGVKQSGVQVSQVVAGLLFPGLSIWIGWTGAALFAASIAVLMLLWSLRRLPPEQPTDWRSLKLSYRSLRKNTGGLPRLPLIVWYFAAIAFLSGAGTLATNVYLSLFAVNELGIDVIIAGFALGIAGLLGVISRIWWGRALGRGSKASSLLALIAMGGTVGALSLVVASVTNNHVMFWVGVILHGLTVLGTNVVINGGAMLLVGADRIGAASGIITMGVYGGFTVGPVAMGFLIESTGSYLTGWVSVGLVYVVFLAVALSMRRMVQNRSGVSPDYRNLDDLDLGD